MNFYGERHNEKYTYRRVSWQDFTESIDYGNITSGSAELSALSDLKATCSFDFIGEVPDTTDYVRIYYSFTDDAGEYGEWPIGTFIVSYSGVVNENTKSGMIKSGTAEGSSLLKRLNEKKVGYPLTIPAGTNVIQQAVQICELMHLRTNNPTDTGYTTKNAHTFEPSDSYLTVVNWLLTNATPQYQAVFPDAYGIIQIVPYIAPDKRTPVEIFKDGENCIFQRQVNVENDWQETCNEFFCNYEDDLMSLWASAYVKSGAKFATDENGDRHITADPEDVTELNAETAEDRLQELIDLAVVRLKDGCSEIEHVTITHAYLPYLSPNDAITVEYGTETWSGNITNMPIGLVPGTQCSTKTRKFLDNDLTIMTDGGINWQI